VELRTGEDAGETPGQWPSTAEPAVMILHGLRAGSLVVTDTGCCPSAARRRRPDLRNHNLNRPLASQLRQSHSEGKAAVACGWFLTVSCTKVVLPEDKEYR
jgi:hypothetical protein